VSIAPPPQQKVLFDTAGVLFPPLMTLPFAFPSFPPSSSSPPSSGTRQTFLLSLSIWTFNPFFCCLGDDREASVLFLKN